MWRQKTTPPGGHAAVYDAFMWPFERAVLGAWRRRLGMRAAGRVLEIGAGTGSQLRWYAPGVVVTALEPDSVMAARARPRARRARAPVEMVIGSAEELPCAAASFDTVVFTFAFCSMDDPVKVLGEVRRVLMP
ncbi:MAG TPA: class I SAM-dependent methyltransferase, partial [Thermoleophilia bacterium]|nr:class I SAM-dependent methyltransferase [Thermoleophilia bacterium]